MIRRPISDCHEPWEWLVIGPLGGVMPCCFTPKQVGNLNEQTIEEVWNGPDMIRLRRSILNGYIDRVCRHAGCKYVRDTEKAFGVDAYDLRCPIDEEVDLRANGRTDHLISGWSYPEYWGVWSEGETASLLLDLPERPSVDLRLEVLCRGAGHEQFPVSFIGVQVNGHHVDRWEFRYPETTDQSVWRTIGIQAELMVTDRIDLQFLIERPLLPALWGIEDGRLLGIGLSALRIVPVPSS
jgi:hypothetical protein